jgi:outer membrane protein assembly factor BamB
VTRNGSGFVAAALALGLGGGVASSQSWPQWGGPGRDFKAAPAVRLAASWPAGGPRELWSRPLGEGYSGIATDGTALFTLYRPVKGIFTTIVERVWSGTTAPEVVIALDAATGQTLWEHSYDAPILPRMNVEYGTGPHATPLVAGDAVFTVGSTGRMHALDRKTGRVLWSHDLYGELKGSVQGRGYACSPLAHGSTVIVTVGGAGQALIAFDRATGRIAWKNGDVDVSPSSPMLITVDGQEQLVLFHASGVAGFDPATGAQRWNHPHSTDYGLNISLPSWAEGVLVISSAYSGGSRGLHLAQAGGRTMVRELWASNRLRVHFGSLIRVGGRVIASSGDFGPAFLTAVDARTGAVAWQERGFARANLVAIGERLLILDEDGTLALATPRPDGLTVHARADVLSAKAWTAPSVAGSRVYLRDRATIKALELPVE